MRFRVRKTAHVFERLGLALAGAACGLFVGAYVGSSVHALTTQGFLLAMMLAGAVGFYLGIDTPPLPFLEDTDDPADTRIDAAEFLSAVGTLCATLAAFFSVGVIVLREEPHPAWTWLVLIGWIGGVAMQILSGAKARMRK